jgi:hypothetical protein
LQKAGTTNQNIIRLNDINSSNQKEKEDEKNSETHSLIDEESEPKKKEPINEKKAFANGKDTLKFDEFINLIRDSCAEQNQAENFLILAFSMFDREK